MKVRFKWADPTGEIEIEDWWFEELKKHPQHARDSIFDAVSDNYSPQLVLNQEDMRKLEKELKK